MQRLTQTGNNCLQTCVAMLLGVSLETLPDQHAIDDHERFTRALQAYLAKHHDKVYLEVGPEMFGALAAEHVFHVLIGETLRMTPEKDEWHAIVGVAGEPYWDVHPSRAGLTRVVKWGVLAPLVEGMRERVAGVASECLCPACGNAVASA